MKIKKYPFGQQLRMYKNPIICGESKEKEMSFDSDKATLDPQKSLENSVSRARQKILDLLLCNNWEWFITITFDPEKIDSYDYLKTSKALSKYLNNLKQRKAFDLQYLGVPEKHKSGRYHYHFLMSNINGLELVDSGHKDKKGRTVYNIGNYSLGWTTATCIDDSRKASSYVTKYITKDLVDTIKNKKMYWRSRNLKEPEVETYYLSDESKNYYKQSIQKNMTTSAKVVKVETSSYKNEIEYIWNDIT